MSIAAFQHLDFDIAASLSLSPSTLVSWFDLSGSSLSKLPHVNGTMQPLFSVWLIPLSILVEVQMSMCLNTWFPVGETVWQELGGVFVGTGYWVSKDFPESFSVLWVCLKMRALSSCSSTCCCLPACCLLPCSPPWWSWTWNCEPQINSSVIKELRLSVLQLLPFVANALA